MYAENRGGWYHRGFQVRYTCQSFKKSAPYTFEYILISQQIFRCWWGTLLHPMQLLNMGSNSFYACTCTCLVHVLIKQSFRVFTSILSCLLFSSSSFVFYWHFFLWHVSSWLVVNKLDWKVLHVCTCNPFSCWAWQKATFCHSPWVHVDTEGFNVAAI